MYRAFLLQFLQGQCIRGHSPNCQMSMVAMAGSTGCQYFSFSARAAEMQGITISATTAGRMPLKMRIITWLSWK